jgi:predicted exporter
MPLSRRSWSIVFWLAATASVAVYTSLSLRVDSDLTAFMPRARSAEHGMLLAEIREGAVGRTWLLAVAAASPEPPSLLASRLAQKLRSSDHFRNVYAGAARADPRLQQLLFEYRYLLDPGGGAQQFTTSVLRRGFEAGLARLRSPVSPFEKTLVSSDPSGALRRIVENLQLADPSARIRDGVWLSEDGSRAFMIAETFAPGTDLQAQEDAAAVITAAFEEARLEQDGSLTLTGPPAFAIAAKARIQHEAILLSIVSFSLVTAILFAVYRRVSLVILISMPIWGGILGATAVCSALYGSVHGISLAFGATLLGVALDYPIHLLSHARSGEGLTSSLPRMWPTLRLGVATTVLGFAAMLTADFPGIQQIAVFSISGLICAALLTRYWLAPLDLRLDGKKLWLSRSAAVTDRAARSMWWIVPIVWTAASLRLLNEPGAAFNADIGELSPVPREVVAEDAEIRAAMGIADPGNVLLVRSDSMESVLETQEALLPTLERAVALGYLQDFSMAASFLPSQMTQRSRQAALPDRGALLARIAEAQSGLPFRPAAFQQFVDDVEAARALPALDETALSGTLLGSRLDSLVRRQADNVHGIVVLDGLTHPDALRALLEDNESENVSLIQVNESANDLINRYRDDIVARSALALIFIVVVLAVALRSLGRVVRVIFPAIGAVLTAGAVPILFGHALNVFHLVSLLLVAGIGLDYSLFRSRPRTDPEDYAATQQSLFVCALSTATVFTVLALSTVPVLYSVGGTVAVGTVTAFALSAFFGRPPPHERT